MTRLLFAAARGARIEQLIVNSWYPTRMIPANADDPILETKPCRIHPDDEALQYGPISESLRDDRNVGCCVYDYDWRLQYYFADYMDVSEQLWHGDELHRSLFLLILAEALADLGM